MSIKTIFAVPGAGKTTYAAHLVQKINKSKQYKGVITNFPCYGALDMHDHKLLGRIHLEDYAIIIDEAGVIYNNREWKSMPRETVDFLKFHRHYGCDMWFISQTYSDMDNKIRDLSDELFLMKKIGPFTYIKRIWKSIGIDESMQILDIYGFSLFVTNKVIYRPRYYKYFNSWDKKELTPHTLELWNTPITPVTLIDRFYYKLMALLPHKKNKDPNSTDNISQETSKTKDNKDNNFNIDLSKPILHEQFKSFKTSDKKQISTLEKEIKNIIVNGEVL